MIMLRSESKTGTTAKRPVWQSTSLHCIPTTKGIKNKHTPTRTQAHPKNNIKTKIESEKDTGDPNDIPKGTKLTGRAEKESFFVLVFSKQLWQLIFDWNIYGSPFYANDFSVAQAVVRVSD